MTLKINGAGCKARAGSTNSDRVQESTIRGAITTRIAPGRQGGDRHATGVFTISTSRAGLLLFVLGHQAEATAC